MPDVVDPVQENAELRALLAEREAELAVARAELTGARLRIEQYKAQLAQLRRMQFGRSSEKLDAQIQQLELLDLGVELLRGTAELHPPQLGELSLVLFDAQPGAGQLGPCHRQLGLALGQQGTQ